MPRFEAGEHLFLTRDDGAWRILRLFQGAFREVEDRGEGDCDGDGECMPGLVCARRTGADFGFPEKIGVCQ